MNLATMATSIGRRIYGLFARGVVTRVDYSTSRQTVQVTVHDGEVRDGVESWQPYGFASAPLPGAEHLVASLGGDPSHSVVICIDDRRYRLTSLNPGEVALYDDTGANQVTLKSDRVEVKGPMVVVVSNDVRLGSATAPYAVVEAGNPLCVCPMNPISGHLMGSTVVKGD
jgi:phage baseplate assembly protein V